MYKKAILENTIIDDFWGMIPFDFFPKPIKMAM